MVTVVMSLGVLLAVVVPGALPSWADATTLTGNLSDSGAPNLQVDGGSSGNRADLALAPGALVPGTSKALVVTLTNAGDAALTYSATGVSLKGDTGGNLSPALRFSVVVGGAVAGGSGNETCVGGTQSFGPARLSGSGTDVVPSSSSPLQPGETQSVCIVVALPAATANAAQGDSAEATIVFQAVEAS